MKRLVILLAVIVLASCTQPVIERYYYTEPAAEEPIATEPAPEPYVPTEYERYLLYVVDTTGAIMYFDDCNDISGGWMSKDEKYSVRLKCFQLTIEIEGLVGPGRPWVILTNQTYVAS